jgi:hypothetical protein
MSTRQASQMREWGKNNQVKTAGLFQKCKFEDWVITKPCISDCLEELNPVMAPRSFLILLVGKMALFSLF